MSKVSILALAAALCLPLLARADQLDDDLAGARTLLISGKEDQAADKLDALEKSARAALLKDANDAHASYILGIAAMYNGHDAVAVRSLDAALALDASNALFLLGRAQLAIFQEKPAEAVPFIQKILDKDPKNIDAWEMRGEAHRDAKALAEALRDYGQAVDLSDSTRKARNLQIIGEIHQQQNQLDQAFTAWRSALVAAPQFTPALFSIGSVYQQQGSFDLALASFTQLVTLKPDEWRAWSKIVQLNESLGKIAERDAARSRILALNKAGKIDASQFCREQFPLDPASPPDKQVTIMVFEYFNTPDPAPLRYAFNFVEPDGKTVRKRISLIPNLAPPPTPNSFHLDCYTTTDHEVLANFLTEPTYEQTRDLVRQYIADKLKPLSTEKLPDPAAQPAGAAR